ncbi:E3 ubiquitin-protein ligase ZNF598 [Microcaecilia unicolor]|uniref:RING-type E3 ubiquitin transferase n=1 Tax=Microcaecilia unicolor TaxID=1415580 RepID=A0A6P7YVT7_9AMPH|nr:E3 ubiquitin-protein ligase ZNF598 [Microcaecilia unicolor]
MAFRPPERSCVLCCQELEVFAVGKCDHYICFRCSTKMRVLCEQRYCAVCREELDKVAFVKKLSPFSTIATHQLQCEKKYGIYFADGKVFSLYRRLLQHECSLCPETRPFHSFQDLEQHMRKQHELFCCKLCVKYLKNFTYERKWYSRKDLARHRIHGDSDDTSHRGHPLCKFCDERYLDNDELLKHLRRDHYFCHFCDSDGAQDYYSDYDYLREHFRETHFLCEEGRCVSEQFTHAFRTEIDYKAHKTSFHSKNRAEARQNRQIDLQFNYTPRHQRRNEGVVSREDFEEVDRYNRQQGRTGRGGSRGGQNRRGSWRYKREEEDREIAAAVRASVAARRQEERKQGDNKEDGNKPRRDDGRDPEEGSSSKKMSRPPQDTSAAKEVVKPIGNAGTLSQEDSPAFGSMVAGPLPSSIESVSPKLKEEDFPSLSTSVSSAVPTVSTGLSVSYASARKSSAFQEEDFPALVSKHKPNKTVSTITSAWANGSSKNMVKTASSNGISPNPPMKKSSSSGSKVSQKSRKTPVSEEEDDEEGKSTLEIKNTPTMFDISSLLTSSSAQTVAKLGKKKRMGSEKKSCSSSPPAPKEAASSSHKENVLEAERTPSPQAVSILSDKSNTVANGHTEKKGTDTSKSKEPPGLKKAVVVYQCPLPDEDFPALENHTVSRTPPPGFTSAASLKSCHPPPGLSAHLSNPPPGFTTIPPKSTSSDSPHIPAKEPSPSMGSYLVPENFQQRNIHLIQSIKDFLQSDESRFNEFKTYSGKFRQGLISAAEYYRNCRDLLGENFKKVFNELLVLLPDTAKQQELLSAHNDFRIEEKQTSNRGKKNRNVWQTNSTPSELDFSICPSCKQVVAEKDAAAHKTLHVEDDEFPSLQAIRRIIS